MKKPAYQDSVRRSITLPKDLLEQIEGRTKLSRRSVNQEIVTLLEWSIDARVQDDLAEIERLRQLPAG